MKPKFRPVGQLPDAINQFWHNYVALGDELLNHSSDASEIAICLEYFVSVCERRGMPTSSVDELVKLFRRNKSKNPYQLKNVMSRINQWPLRFYVFQRDWFEREFMSVRKEVPSNGQ